MSITLPVTTIVGTLTADPDVKFTNSGKAVANLNIACNTRRKDQQTGQWVDGETTFLRATVWGDLAERVGDSLSKGDRVIAHGTVQQKNFTDKEGNARSNHELSVEAIGPELRFATAVPQKVSGGGGGRSQATEDAWGGTADPGWG